jgi:hypothetical protein
MGRDPFRPAGERSQRARLGENLLVGSSMRQYANFTKIDTAASSKKRASTAPRARQRREAISRHERDGLRRDDGSHLPDAGGVDLIA